MQQGLIPSPSVLLEISMITRHVDELNFPSAEAISDLRQQLKRKRHGRDDDDDPDEEDEDDTTSERSGASGGGGDNDLEAAVVAATAKADTTPPGESVLPHISQIIRLYFFLFTKRKGISLEQIRYSSNTSNPKQSPIQSLRAAEVVHKPNCRAKIATSRYSKKLP